MNAIKVAFFDVDRTIFTTNSGNKLVWKAFRNGLMGIKELTKAIYYAMIYRIHIGNALEIIDKMALWTQGVNENDLNKLCADIFKDYLIKKIRPEIIEEINTQQNDGVKVVILSAALSAICKPTANLLKIDTIICSELEVVDGIFTGKPSGKLCYGIEKLNRVIEYCHKNSIELSETSCYTDSISDVPVLAAVAHPYCISPDSKLRKEAKYRGWEVIDW